MKSLFAVVLLALCFSPVLRADDSGTPASTYTGHVDGVKTLSDGAVAVNLDGTFPNSKMTLYISSSAKTQFTRLPVEGDTVTAVATITQYQGHPEMKLSSPSQLTFATAAAAPAAGSPASAPGAQ
jgi:hypothetical protein